VGIEENKGIVRRFLDEVVGRGDMDVVNELCTADAVNHAAAPDRQQGIESIRAVIEFSRRAQPDQRWVEQHVVAEGDLVVVYGRRDGTWEASSFRGIDTPSSGGYQSSSLTCSGFATARSLSTGRSATTWG
jgi:predicted ester cyclase